MNNNTRDFGIISLRCFTAIFDCAYALGNARKDSGSRQDTSVVLSRQTDSTPPRPSSPIRGYWLSDWKHGGKTIASTEASGIRKAENLGFVSHFEIILHCGTPLSRAAKLPSNALARKELFPSYFVVVAELFRDFCKVVSQSLVCPDPGVKRRDYVVDAPCRQPEYPGYPFGIDVF